MSGVQIFRLVLLGLVFLVWTGLMLRTLFVLRARASESGGQQTPGPGGFLRQVGRFLSAPEDRRDRNTLAFLTVVMAIMIGTQVLSAAP